MEVEPQRLIAVSLGKIALSRGQRGGQRLHKSLLVAGVLFNARTACVSPCPMQSDDDEEDLPSPFHEANVVESDSDYRAEIFDEQHQFSLMSLEAVTPAQCVLSRSIVDRLLPVTHTAHTESASPSDINRRHLDANAQNLSDISSDSRYSVDRCSGGSVIELTVVESCNTQPESTIFLSNDVPSPSRSACKRGRESTEFTSNEFRKRLRFNSDDYPAHKVSSSLCTNLSSNHEHMQTDNNTHITSLAQTFNSGFSGLLHSVEPVEYTSCRYYGSDQDESDHETSSSESIISCSTQIREALETLSRPMDTLTRSILAVSV